MNKVYQNENLIQKRIKLKTQYFQNQFKEQFKIFENQIALFQRNTNKIFIRTMNFILQKRINWNSQILKSIQQSWRLQMFFQKTIKQVNLLFRASQNKYSARNFHSKCDNIPNTITLIQTQYGKIIGGYTPLPWHSVKQFSSDGKLQSFIFSLTNNHKLKLCNHKKAIYEYRFCGPTFGEGFDICIQDNSNQSNRSSAKIGSSYIHDEYKYDDTQTYKKFLGGTYFGFKTKQYQIYQIKF